MRKYIVIPFVLLLVLIVTLCSCTRDMNYSGNDSFQASEKSSTINSKTSVFSSNVKNSTTSTSQTVSSKEQVTSKVNTNSTKSTTDNSNKVFLNTPIDPVDKYFLKTNHTPINKEEYYQYTFLNDIEKEAYRRIRVAVLSYDKTVEVSDLRIDLTRTQQLVECFFADNPQYFWAKDSFGIKRNGDILLDYNDDFTKIDKKRKEFNEAVFNIVSSINPDDSQYEKELAIHNYLTKMTRYDQTAQYNPFVNGILDYAYNSYGTIVENRGVCEGYTKAFQYLCYIVGINSNVVYGDSHIWNTVQIDGEWYQVDVTWNDPIKSDGSSGDGHHKYFNLTSSKMYEAHALSTESVYDCIKVPNCTSTKNAYH